MSTKTAWAYNTKPEIPCLGEGAATPCRHRHNRYLMDCAEWSALVQRANNRCEICGVPGRDTSHGYLVIDHEYGRDGGVRGLLCSRCNTRIAYSTNTFNREATARYLANPWHRQRAAATPSTTNAVESPHSECDTKAGKDLAKQPIRETLPQQLGRLYPDGAPASLIPVRLVPVEVFGAHCQCHEDRLLADDGPECGDFGYGICDAVSAWSDCNRAIGRIYRRDEDESIRDVGDAILVWVTPEQAALFDVVFGSP